MNVRYFILTIALIPSIIYTAESPLKKPSRKSSSALLDKQHVSTRKDAAQVVTHICLLTQQIKFNEEKKTLCDLLEVKEFGITPMFSTRSKLDNYPEIDFLEEGPLSSISKKQNLKIALAMGRAIYISNIQEKKFIKYGALVFHPPLDQESTPATVNIVANFFLLWFKEKESLLGKNVDNKNKDRENGSSKLYQLQ